MSAGTLESTQISTHFIALEKALLEVLGVFQEMHNTGRGLVMFEQSA